MSEQTVLLMLWLFLIAMLGGVIIATIRIHRVLFHAHDGIVAMFERFLKRSPTGRKGGVMDNKELKEIQSLLSGCHSNEYITRAHNIKVGVVRRLYQTVIELKKAIPTPEADNG